MTKDILSDLFCQNCSWKINERKKVYETTKTGPGPLCCVSKLIITKILNPPFLLHWPIKTFTYLAKQNYCWQQVFGQDWEAATRNVQVRKAKGLAVKRKLADLSDWLRDLARFFFVACWVTLFMNNLAFWSVGLVI